MVTHRRTSSQSMCPHGHSVWVEVVLVGDRPAKEKEKEKWRHEFHVATKLNQLSLLFNDLLAFPFFPVEHVDKVGV